VTKIEYNNKANLSQVKEIVGLSQRQKFQCRNAACRLVHWWPGR